MDRSPSRLSRRGSRKLDYKESDHSGVLVEKEEADPKQESLLNETSTHLPTPEGNHDRLRELIAILISDPRYWPFSELLSQDDIGCSPETAQLWTFAKLNEALNQGKFSGTEGQPGIGVGLFMTTLGKLWIPSEFHRPKTFMEQLAKEALQAARSWLFPRSKKRKLGAPSTIQPNRTITECSNSAGLNSGIREKCICILETLDESSLLHFRGLQLDELRNGLLDDKFSTVDCVKSTIDRCFPRIELASSRSTSLKQELATQVRDKFAFLWHDVTSNDLAKRPWGVRSSLTKRPTQQAVLRKGGRFRKPRQQVRVKAEKLQSSSTITIETHGRQARFVRPSQLARPLQKYMYIMSVRLDRGPPRWIISRVPPAMLLQRYGFTPASLALAAK